ncbi:MAG: glycosyltransferase [Candidatus Moranbacteria bacterium]|nr:glycosyltransferase [Candidatus Moranbacteria bacterium]NTW75560.1 glycosyltransferase [Candidatus Moranbacteria bacterium]
MEDEKMKRKRVRVFSPAYNVGSTLEKLLGEFNDVFKILKSKKLVMEVCILDDNSTDDTSRILNDAQNSFSWLVVKRNDQNIGNAGNIIAGYTWASEDPEVDYVVCMDADGEHSPYAMVRHIDMLERRVCDGIAGSIIFPDPFIDRSAIDKAMQDINGMGPKANNEVLAQALQLMEVLRGKLIAADNHNDRNMMRFWGRMQSTMAKVDGTFYIQAPGYNVHQRHRVAQALEFLKRYRAYLEEKQAGEFPRWGLHFVMIYLISIGTGARLKAAYLECFGQSPNRTPEKLAKQSNAAAFHGTWLPQFAAEILSGS